MTYDEHQLEYVNGVWENIPEDEEDDSEFSQMVDVLKEEKVEVL